MVIQLLFCAIITRISVPKSLKLTYLVTPFSALKVTQFLVSSSFLSYLLEKRPIHFFLYSSLSCSILSTVAFSYQLTLQIFFLKTSSLKAMKFIRYIFYLPNYPMKMFTKAEHSHIPTSYKLYFILFSSSNTIPHNLLFWWWWW